MAEKKIMCISHVERLVNSEKYTPESYRFPSDDEKVIISKGIDETTGLVYAKREVVRKPMGEDYKDMKYTDFGIEQLQIVGADSMLQKVTQLSGVNGIAQADYIDQVASSIPEEKNIENK